MANKIKAIYSNNLIKIREQLGYTQEEMGKILGVSERMICNYETSESNLPIDKAILLSKKYNYSLDWIYDIKKETDSKCSIHINPTQLDKFVVDIRNFVSFSNNMCHFNIPDNYWVYIKECNTIISSNITQNEKCRQIAELNGKYKKKNLSSIIWRISIPENEIMSYLHFDSSFIPYVGTTNDEDFEPTKEQVAEAIFFLNELTK